MTKIIVRLKTRARVLCEQTRIVVCVCVCVCVRGGLGWNKEAKYSQVGIQSWAKRAFKHEPIASDSEANECCSLIVCDGLAIDRKEANINDCLKNNPGLCAKADSG